MAGAVLRRLAHVHDRRLRPTPAAAGAAVPSGRQHRTLGGGADEQAVAGEDAAGVGDGRFPPGGEALRELVVAELQGQALRLDVDRDRVAVANDGERTAA